MGCATSRPPRATAADDHFSFSKPSATSAAAAELLGEGSLADQGRTSAILQLSLSLSVLAAEHGRTETELCDATVAARRVVSVADRMSIWRVRNRKGGDSFEEEKENMGHLVCLASDAMGMQGRSLALSAVDAPPCAALAASRNSGSLPLVVDLSDAHARAELEQRYGLTPRAVLYVPIVALSSDPSEESAANQLGVIELVLVDPGHSKESSFHNAVAGRNGERNGEGPAPPLSSEPQAARSTPDTSFNNGEPFGPTARRQLAQLGGYLATALQSLRLSDEDLQGERLLYRMLPKVGTQHTHTHTHARAASPPPWHMRACPLRATELQHLAPLPSRCVLSVCAAHCDPAAEARARGLYCGVV